MTAIISGKSFSYLALGDSYTIGEQVAATDSFPVQTAALLRAQGLPVNDPFIIAKTGWTTDELVQGITQANPAGPYDMVTLLIGVNNQYRGYSPGVYETEFAGLLEQAIAFAGGYSERVLVLSIPDWGVTPYASGRNRGQIAADIDAYNTINHRISQAAGVAYLNITPGTREAATDQSLLTGDGLHPSGKEYQRWAAQAAAYYQTCLVD